MLRVAVFDEEHEKDLEKEINHFLKELDDNQVKDIKYSVEVTIDDDGDQLYCYSALILYRI
ncbi:Sporulation protein cse60 [Bacillus sp. SA1-12]|uniref:sporulation protein Cse60 n=1 Tax=Bacillus sp. SA1-12 TaxID=1455638 RepID=UPI0006271585|nr:sporulation protein Cse60 [Bacillus sp. SA1-12]KKI88835.1 Sporulation protein cse60 [Bacillus sp. SA1-12]